MKPDLGMEDKEFWSETVSYMITHRLERFPEKNEEICFELYDEDGKILPEQLCFKVLEIDDTAIGKVEVSQKGFQSFWKLFFVRGRYSFFKSFSQ